MKNTRRGLLEEVEVGSLLKKIRPNNHDDGSVRSALLEA
jgi:hypothetical protein